MPGRKQPSLSCFSVQPLVPNLCFVVPKQESAPFLCGCPERSKGSHQVPEQDRHRPFSLAWRLPTVRMETNHEKGQSFLSPHCVPGPWTWLNCILRPTLQAPLWRLSQVRARETPRVRNLPQGRTVDKQQQLQPDSQSQKAGAEPREPRGAPGGGGRSRGLGPVADERSAPGTAPERLPAAPDGGARGAGGALPAGSCARPPASARPAPGTGLEPRVPLAGSQPARPEPWPQPELAGGSRPGTQSPPAGLRASPAPASPARPQQAPQPWPGQERPPLAAPCPGRTPDRPVTCAQVLGRPGAAPFPWFKVRAERAERSRGEGALAAGDAGREAPAQCPRRLGRPLQPAGQYGARSLPHAAAGPHHPSHLHLPWTCAPGEEAVDCEWRPRWAARQGGRWGPTVPRDAWSLSWPGHEGNRGEKVSERSLASVLCGARS